MVILVPERRYWREIAEVEEWLRSGPSTKKNTPTRKRPISVADTCAMARRKSSETGCTAQSVAG
jgi:hypothetical protein